MSAQSEFAIIEKFVSTENSFIVTTFVIANLFLLWSKRFYISVQKSIIVSFPPYIEIRYSEFPTVQLELITKEKLASRENSIIAKTYLIKNLRISMNK